MGGLEGRERGSQLGRRGQYRCDGKEPKCEREPGRRRERVLRHAPDTKV